MNGKTGDDGPPGEIPAAIAASTLRGVPVELLEQLTAQARRVTIPAGSTIHHAGESQPHFELVLDGLVRVFILAPDGRSMTVRYCRRGGLIGAATMFAPRSAHPFGIQAVSDSALLRMDPLAARQLADEQPLLARALLIETSERVLAFVAELARSAFAPVRERLIAHLLSIAAEEQGERQLIAPVTQQELAEAVGSVREVVVRTLRDLRREGTIATRRGRIVLIEPERLLDELGTWVPDAHR